MKKLVSVILVCIMALGVFTACKSGSEQTQAKTESSANQSSSESAIQTTGGKKLKVYTSFYAMYDFTKKVGGDKIDVTNLVPAGTEPHDWEPATTDVVNLEKADILVYNGASMESWVEKVLGSLQNKNLTAVEASKGLDLMAGHAEEGEETTKYDPHVWLSPENAKKEMENIKNALVQADAANKNTYESNYEKYAAQFDELDQEYKTAATSFTSKDIIVAHQAFGYLCKAYGLNQIAIEGLTADSEPDPARMSEIIKFAKEHKVKTIFFEDLVSPKVAETIAKAVGAKTATFNPLEGLTDEEQSKGLEYVSVMKQNLQTLKDALK
nr:metal ABC transporter substrate-binding protein [uncultured Caproiciproducens sp.]